MLRLDMHKPSSISFDIYLAFQNVMGRWLSSQSFTRIDPLASTFVRAHVLNFSACLQPLLR